jgi:hypothetical protein
LYGGIAALFELTKHFAMIFDPLQQQNAKLDENLRAMRN